MIRTGVTARILPESEGSWKVEEEGALDFAVNRAKKIRWACHMHSAGRDALSAALREGNLTQSAREAEIDRVYLLRLLDTYDMR